MNVKILLLWIVITNEEIPGDYYITDVETLDANKKHIHCIHCLFSQNRDLDSYILCKFW